MVKSKKFVPPHLLCPSPCFLIIDVRYTRGSDECEPLVLALWHPFCCLCELRFFYNFLCLLIALCLKCSSLFSVLSLKCSSLLPVLSLKCYLSMILSFACYFILVSVCVQSSCHIVIHNCFLYPLLDMIPCIIVLSLYISCTTFLGCCDTCS